MCVRGAGGGEKSLKVLTVEVKKIFYHVLAIFFLYLNKALNESRAKKNRET